MSAETHYKRGDEIGGRFLVFDTFAGGMGEVYLCMNMETLQPYAIKTFKKKFLTSQALYDAFKTEVEVWIGLGKHPHIVRCFFMDDIEDRPFMFLEWIAGDEQGGTDLRSRLRHGPLDLRAALDFTLDICRGLVYAGQKQPGIVHRDLKPDNILVDQSQVAKITDFGLAKIVQASRLELPSEDIQPGQRLHLSSVGGTPPYMAPEQWLAQELDARTDIYAVGCILYELLTGRWPFLAATLSDFGNQHLQAAIPTLPKDERIPASLDKLLTRCMAKRREERFSSFEELSGELSQVYEKQFSLSPRNLTIDADLDARDFLNRGTTYLRLERHEEALADFANALALNENYALVYNNRAGVYGELQRYDEALAEYAHAIELDPNLDVAYRGRADILAKLQRYDEALASYTRASEIAPTEPISLNQRGELYSKLGHDEEALADFDRSLELDQTQSRIYNLRATTKVKTGRFIEALADFSHAIRLKPDYPEAFSNRGLVYQQSGQLREALADHNRAVELDPTSAEVFFNRAITQEMLQCYDEALADYTRAIQLDPEHEKAYANRGTTYQILERFEEAIADFARALQLNPEDVKPYYNRGSILSYLGNQAEALSDFLRAAEIDPLYARAHFGIGTIYGGQGRYEMALAAFEKAAQLGYAPAARYAELIRQSLF